MILSNNILGLGKASAQFVFKGKNTKFPSRVDTLSVGAAFSKYTRDLTTELCALFAEDQLQSFFAFLTKEKELPKKEEI